MGKSKKVKIKYESTMEPDQVVSYLENLLDGLRSGTLHVETEAEAVTLHPQGPTTLEVEAKQKREKESFEISLKWYRVPESVGDEALTISDEELPEAADREPLVTEPPPAPEIDEPPPAPEPPIPEPFEPDDET